MPRPSGKATISLKGNAKNLPDIYFRELVQLYSRDCRARGIEEITIAGYEYACKKFLAYLQEDIRCSDLRQELFNDYQMELATRVKAETVNSYLFKISPVLKFGKERGYITADIQLSHMAYQEHFKDVDTAALLTRPNPNHCQRVLYPRIVPLREGLVVILHEYMIARNEAADDHLFCSIYGDMMEFGKGLHRWYWGWQVVC